jgi:two-component system KDP operon response regulator KdpE
VTALRLLIVEDDLPLRRAVHNALRGEDVRIVEAATLAEGIALTAAERPDIVVLDLGLPDGDGNELLHAVRSWSSVPVLVLSARTSDADKVRALDAGADDYLVKPFSPSELQARVRALVRRARTADAPAMPQLEADGAVIDLTVPSVVRDGHAIHLTRTEWGLLRAMIRHQGRTQTHHQLFHAVWGNAHNDAAQLLRVHVRSLRRKIERDPVRPTIIVTEPGVGYRFESGATG